MIEAYVTMGQVAYTLNDALRKVTHVRGFAQTTSYCVIELAHATQNVINEMMNHGTFKLCYGKDGWNTPWLEFGIISVDNSVKLTDVQVRIVGVELGFTRMTTQERIRSFAGQTVSEIFESVARQHQLTPKVSETAGKYTFVQPNITDLRFLNEFLLPIAIDKAGTSPYLMTIDAGTLYLQPPSLKKGLPEDDPLRNHILVSNIDLRIHKFTARNHGIFSDMSTGNEFTTHGYNFIQKGYTPYTQNRQTAGPLLNKSPYISQYTRQEALPYPEKWMIMAANRNRVARSQFVIDAEAVVEGRADLTFDEEHQITIPETREFNNTEGGLIEYSGKYYVFSIANVIHVRSWLAHLQLMSNAFRFGKTTDQPDASGQVDVVKTPVR